jgi:hypothetical protein
LRIKKAIREWAFNLFTKRITIKISNLDDSKRLEFLLNKLMNELIAQGHSINGVAGGNDEYFNVFGVGNGKVCISPHGKELGFRRLTNI